MASDSLPLLLVEWFIELHFAQKKKNPLGFQAKLSNGRMNFESNLAHLILNTHILFLAGYTINAKSTFLI